MRNSLTNLLRAEIDPGFRKRASFILEAVEKKQPRTVLEVGCGRGFYIQALTHFHHIKKIDGCDLNPKYLAAAQNSTTDSRVHLQVADIYDLPYKDKIFDFIICSEVLEHLPDDKLALKKMTRLLKPKGTLAITVPNSNFPFLWDPINWILMRFFHTHVPKNIWWLAGIWADHERLYTEDQLTKLFKKTGLTVLQSRKVVEWCWPFSHFLLYGIGKNLVESLQLKSFNRFNQKKKGLLTYFIADLFSLPSTLFDKREPKSSVNLLALIEK